MPFDPNSYIQEKSQSFDPDAYISEKQGPSLGQKAIDAVEGFGNAMSGGTLPAIQAMYSATMKDPTGDLDDQLRAKGTKIIQPDWNDPGQQLQSFEKYRQNAATNDPEAFYGGEVAGAIPTAVSGLVGGAKAAAPAIGGLLKKEAMKGLLKYGGPAAAAYNIYKSVTKKE